MSANNIVIGILEYGCGNIQSVINALEVIGADMEIISNPDELSTVSKLLLPGVGSFDHAMDNLEKGGFVSVLKEWVQNDDNQLLGICLGMQLLCNRSDESVLDKKGLCLIDAEVKCLSDMTDDSIKIPHMGWNEVEIKQPENMLFNSISDCSDYYFVHSYGVFSEHSDVVLAETMHGVRFASVITNGINVYGVQFHPEKSQSAGITLLKNFISNG